MAREVAARGVGGGPFAAWHICAVIAGLGLICWGLAGAGQLGYGDRKNREAPPEAGVHRQM